MTIPEAEKRHEVVKASKLYRTELPPKLQLQVLHRLQDWIFRGEDIEWDELLQQMIMDIVRQYAKLLGENTELLAENRQLRGHNPNNHWRSTQKSAAYQEMEDILVAQLAVQYHQVRQGMSQPHPRHATMSQVNVTQSGPNSGFQSASPAMAKLLQDIMDAFNVKP